jgi:hypothetical protein
MMSMQRSLKELTTSPPFVPLPGHYSPRVLIIDEMLMRHNFVCGVRKIHNFVKGDFIVFVVRDSGLSHMA